MTITHDALDLTVQPSPPALPSGHQTWDPPAPALPSGHQTWDPPAPALLVTSSGHHWRPVQACSLDDFPPPKPILTSGGHQSTYDLQPDGTHPIGMLSCLFLIVLSFFYFLVGKSKKLKGREFFNRGKKQTQN